MNPLEPLLEEFDAISLGELEGAKLLDRMDTKFVFRRELLPEILHGMAKDYRVLEIDRIRANRYESLYFDTDGLDLYTKHHSGKLNRHKVRFRKYLDSGLCFFEIKLKTNKGRTIKTRTQRNEIDLQIEGSAADLVNASTPHLAGELRPKLRVMYTRCTFANKLTPERLTIDLGLSYANGSSDAAFPNLVIAELKQDQSATDSPFSEIMRRYRIPAGGISKYCFGIMQLYPCVKQNLFRQKSRLIKELAS